MHGTVGIQLLELKTLGVDGATALAGGFTLAEVLDAGYEVAQIQKEGIGVAELLAAGYTIEGLKAASFTAADFRAAGVRAVQILEAEPSEEGEGEEDDEDDDHQQTAFSLAGLVAGGYTLPEVREETEVTIAQLLTVGFSVAQLTADGVRLSHRPLTAPPLAVGQLLSPGVPRSRGPTKRSPLLIPLPRSANTACVHSCRSRSTSCAPRAPLSGT